MRTALHMRVTTCRCVSQSCCLHIFAFFFSFRPTEEEAGGDCTGGSPRVTANARVSGYVCISSAPGNPRLQTSLSSCACTPLTPCANMHALVFFLYVYAIAKCSSFSSIHIFSAANTQACTCNNICVHAPDKGGRGVGVCREGWME